MTNDQWSGHTNNYFASLGTTTYTWSPDSTGVFAHRAAYGVQNVTDGTSNTIAFSESAGHRQQVCGPSSATAPRPACTTSNRPATAPRPCSMPITAIPAVMKDLQTCNQFFQTQQHPAGDDKGYRWATGSPGVTAFKTIVPPNSQQYPWGGCRLDREGGGYEFGEFQNATSNHPGGGNVLFADGSVRFVKSSINMMTWWSLGTKANGEVISADSY